MKRFNKNLLIPTIMALTAVTVTTAPLMAETTPTAGYIFIDKNKNGFRDLDDVILNGDPNYLDENQNGKYDIGETVLSEQDILYTMTFFPKADENGTKYTPIYYPSESSGVTVDFHKIKLDTEDKSYHTVDSENLDIDIDFIVLFSEDYLTYVATTKDALNSSSDSRAIKVEKNKNTVLAYIDVNEYMNKGVEAYKSTKSGYPDEMRLDFGLIEQELTAINDVGIVPAEYESLHYYVISNDQGDVSDISCEKSEFKKITPPTIHPNILFTDKTPERSFNLVKNVIGEGVWTFNEKICGEAIFTPEDGYQGVPTSVDYFIETYHGTQSSAVINLVRETSPIKTNMDVKDVNGSDLDNPIVFEVLPNDEGDIAPSTVKLISFANGELIKSGDESVDTVSKETNLTVANQGVWTVDNGEVTFTPDEELIESPDSIYYIATSNDGVNSDLTEIKLNVLNDDCDCELYTESKVPFGFMSALILFASFFFSRRFFK